MSFDFEIGNPPALRREPEDAFKVLEYVRRELEKLQETVTALKFHQLEPLHAEPERYRDGMVVYADGTDWDPGSGEGIYARYASAWHFLG